MQTSTTDAFDDLEVTEGWLAGRHVWFVSDGSVIPFIAGGDGSADDDDEGDEDEEQDDDDEGDEDEDLESLRSLAEELDLTPSQIRERLRASKRWEQRAKKNKRDLDRLRGSTSSRNAGTNDEGGDAEGGVDAARAAGRAEALREAAERSLEVYIDAQVEAGRLTGDQADELLDIIDPARFIDDEGDVDTDKVKSLIKVIAPPDKGNNGEGKRSLDSGGGRRHGGSGRRGERKSYAAGRDLWEERHGSKKKTS